MKKKLLVIIGLALIGSNIVGCANTSTSSKTPHSAEGQIIGNIPAGSKFSKISMGMPMKQVFDIIGEPTDTQTYITGKAFIPFYMGSDTARFDALYKNEGRITFAGGTGMFKQGAYKVYSITYDPTESGYNK